METIRTLRNDRIFPSTDEALATLRATKWQSYRPPAPIRRKIGAQTFALRPGLTFTPFANPVRCNAHCRFCSEELQRSKDHAPTAHRLIRDYDRYFEGLSAALKAIGDLPMGLSLSGLEATAEPRWLRRLLDTLQALAGTVFFDEKVLYTNGTGLCAHPELVELLATAGFDRIELSRCHYDEVVNQRIMYINRNQPVYRNAAYEALVRGLHGRLHVKNSCILTQAGIADLPAVEAYLDWALSLGVRQVVFRELSRLDATYLSNETAQWVEQNRVPIEPLLQAVAPSISATRPHWRYLSSTLGYYYYNEHFRYRDTVEVVLETSSYPALIKANASLVQKLIFHSNGNLCGDWDPEASVLGNFF